MNRLFTRVFLLALAVFAFQQPCCVARENAGDDRPLDQYQQNQLAVKEFKLADAQLTRVYEKELKSQQSPAIRKALIASQKAWLAFREADGSYESATDEDGSARVYCVFKRMTCLTRQRIHQLKTPFAAGWQEPAAQK